MAAEEGPFHQATADVVAIVKALLNHGGWLGTRAVADAAGVQRDTARRILLQLAEAGWAQRESFEGQDRWTLGFELPRIGMAWLEKLNRAAASLRSEFDRVTKPMLKE